MNKNKKLYLSMTDKKIAGVCAGIAEYLDIDSTIIRIAFVLLALMPPVSGVLLYIILMLVIPQNPNQY